MALIRMIYERLCHVAMPLQLICPAGFKANVSTQQLLKVLAITLQLLKGLMITTSRRTYYG